MRGVWPRRDVGGEEGEVGEIEDGEAGRALEQLLDLLVTLCERDRSELSLTENVGENHLLWGCMSARIWGKRKPFYLLGSTLALVMKFGGNRSKRC